MYEIVVSVHPHCEEAVTAYLDEHYVHAAVRTDPDRNDEGGTLSFYMRAEDWAVFKPHFEKKLREISTIFEVSLPEFKVIPVDENAWKNAWKRYARIYRFGNDLVVKPTWRRLRKPPGCPVISIDPQMAFGTGGHASTRLCIHQLLHIRRENPAGLREVLDVGTGSGILAIAAVLLGARRVVATDIDPDALRVAHENAAKNDVADHIEFTCRPLQQIPGRFDLILANIFESVLTELLEAFTRHLKPGGTLVVSGLLSSQGRAFAERAVSLGLKLMGKRHARSWVSYRFGMTE